MTTGRFGTLACLVLVGAAVLGPPGAAAAEQVSVTTARSGSAVQVQARARVHADWQVAWDTLTDYDHLARFIPGMKRSRQIERRGPAAIVEQVGEARLLLWRLPIEVTVASVERPPHRIEVHALSGSLSRLDGAYRIEFEPAARDGLTLHWEGVIDPGVMLPGALAEPLVRAQVTEQFLGMVGEIERRAGVRQVARAW